MNVAKITGASLVGIQQRYRVISTLVCGSSVQDAETALDLDLCVVVHDNVLDRARLHVQGTVVDVFICGIEKVRRALEKGEPQHFVTLFSTGTFFSGERGSAENLVAIARRTASQPPVIPHDVNAFTLRSLPYDLLRKFSAVKDDDPAAAALIVTLMVSASVRAYFALNRVWTIGRRDRMRVISERNPEAMAAVQGVMESGLTKLRSEPEQLLRMVQLLVGDDVSHEDHWLPGGGA